MLPACHPGDTRGPAPASPVLAAFAPFGIAPRPIPAKVGPRLCVSPPGAAGVPQAQRGKERGRARGSGRRGEVRARRRRGSAPHRSPAADLAGAQACEPAAVQS